MFFNKKNKIIKKQEEDLSIAHAEISLLKERYAGIIDIDTTIADKKKEVQDYDLKMQALNLKFQQALSVHAQLEAEVSLYKDTLEIGSFGLYIPQFNLETSEAYKEKLESNYAKQKELIKNDQAAICSTEWTVGGSKVEGRKMTNQLKKLMLFAFNGECDGLMSKVKWNNAVKTKEKILKSYENINKLGITQQVSIAGNFLNLKLDELALTYEYEEKKYEEKEEQRLIREQMRDEERVQKELEKAQKEAAEEESRYQSALDKARQELARSTTANVDILAEKVKVLEERLHSAHERKERAIALAQLTKVGHIYIISNLGSFGEDVYKIGMTRRLDPLDRVKELGDASVPFQFDVHAVIYSENAPQLENALHKYFHDRRLNRINHKKEFFRVTLTEIEEFVLRQTNAEIQFTKVAEAREYRETMTMLEQFNQSALSVQEKEKKFPVSLI
jgi:hypothetical protein